MAGVEVVKSTVAKVAHQGAHYDEERREKVQHKNQHIDKSKTHLNYNLGEVRWKDMMAVAKEKVKELDKLAPPKRKKADRKTMATTVFYCPNDIKDHRAFFTRLYEEYEKAYPNSLVGMQVHVDEQHLYMDPHKDQMVMSMVHAHVFLVPNDKEKGCNMKSFLNREWYRKVNSICEEVAKEFGSKYHTGEGKHADRSMEQLKAESLKALEKKVQEQGELLDDLLLNKEVITRDILSEVKCLFKEFKELQKELVKKERVFGKGSLEKAKKLEKQAENDIESIEDVHLEGESFVRARESLKALREELNKVEEESLVADDDFEL